MKQLFTLLLIAISVQAFGQIQATLRPTGPSAPEPEDTLILNQYPSDLLAYSLRRLDTAYSGDCIKVRRSSDNAEQDIGFVNNYLDTNSLKTFVGANDGAVVTWYNQASDSFDLDSLSGNAPRIVIAGDIHYEGNLPAIKYTDTNNERLFTSHILDVWTDSIYSWFTVVKKDNLSNERSYFSFPLITYLDTAQSGDDVVVGGVYSGRTVILTDQPIHDHGLAFIYNSVDSTYVYFNNNGPAVGEPTFESSQSEPFSVGYPFSSPDNANTAGSVQELIFWRKDMTADRINIRDAVNTYYTIY